ncbi:MAG: hypothetical protein K2N63_05665, partial [Lachnospiraceae bacterium]|nr:hypothetical protein [Lachnospiraceae bacterium]
TKNSSPAKQGREGISGAGRKKGLPVKGALWRGDAGLKTAAPRNRAGKGFQEQGGRKAFP